jgi:putative endonuclease
MKKQSFIYIITNKNNTVFYTGVTTDIIKRIWEHKQKMTPGFTKKYNIDKLVYYEIFEDIEQAIEREKQIKAGSRKKKIDLIESINKDYRDLYDEIV